jgi:hypothetical protein
MSAMSMLTFLGMLCISLALALMVWLMTRSIWGMSQAERRARVLLKEILTPQEWNQLFWRGYLDIPSSLAPQRVYRVPRGNGYVQVRENGRAVMNLCLQPVERLPQADIVVLHKLMIEAQEEFYLQTANKFHHSL